MRWITMEIESEDMREVARVVREIGKWIADGALKGAGNSLGVEYRYEVEG